MQGIGTLNLCQLPGLSKKKRPILINLLAVALFIFFLIIILPDGLFVRKGWRAGRKFGGKAQVLDYDDEIRCCPADCLLLSH